MELLTNKEKKLFMRTLVYIKPVRFLMVGLYIVTILTTILELIPIYYMGKIIDLIISKNYKGVIDTIITLLVIFLFTAVFSFAETYLNNLLKNKVAYSIKNEFFSKIVRLPAETFDQIRTGEFISRIEEDTAIISKFYIEDILNIILSIVTVLVTGYFIIKLSVSLSIVAMLTFPFTFLIYYLFGKKIKKLSQEGRKITDNYFSFIQETLTSIREIKCLTIESKVSGKFNNFSEQFLQNNMKIAIASTFSGLLNFSVSNISDWVIIAYGAWMIIMDKLSIGSYVAFNGYISRFLTSVQKIVSTNLTIQSTAVSLERLYYLLDAPSEKYDHCSHYEVLNGDINIKNIKFRYKNASSDAIQNITMNIKPNTISTIVGMNGCGKSTLLNLMVRLYEPEEGGIFIDGKAIEEISLESLRRNITYVRQDPFLFNASIKENLLLASPEATDEEILEACKKTYILDYIETLPERFETVIGEGGIILSGGQKQRLSLARAILKKSRIILLDEITSGLDGESENYIMKCVQELATNHTILMITHRLTSIMGSPIIYVMNEGTIEDVGTSEELSSRCEIYQRLFKKSGILKKRWDETKMKGDERDETG